MISIQADFLMILFLSSISLIKLKNNNCSQYCVSVFVKCNPKTKLHFNNFKDVSDIFEKIRK
jgi:hypothetical protein